MRTKHWIVAVLAVGAIASTQAYALTGGRRPVAQQAANSPFSPDVDLGGVAEAQTPKDLPQAIVAEIHPQAPVEVETVIVGFKNGLGEAVKEALIRAAGAVPTEAVPGPETIVATVDRAELDAAVKQLEANLLVDYVAVPEEAASDELPNLLK